MSYRHISLKNDATLSPGARGIENLIAHEKLLFFTADNSIWKTDGVQTTRLIDLRVDLREIRIWETGISNLVIIGDAIYFKLYNTELWQGSINGGKATLLAEIGDSVVTTINDTLAYTYNGTLYLDGKPATSDLIGVKSVSAAVNDSGIYFGAQDNDLSQKPNWSGTQVIKLGGISPVFKDLESQGRFVENHESIYFSGDDKNGLGLGYELMKIDKTGAASLVKDIYQGPDTSDPFILTPAGGYVYFAADDGNSPSNGDRRGWQIWKTDGKSAEIAASDVFYPTKFIPFGDRLIYKNAGSASTSITDPVESDFEELSSVQSATTDATGRIFYSSYSEDKKYDIYIYDHQNKANPCDLDPTIVPFLEQWWQAAGQFASSVTLSLKDELFWSKHLETEIIEIDISKNGSGYYVLELSGDNIAFNKEQYYDSLAAKKGEFQSTLESCTGTISSIALSLVDAPDFKKAKVTPTVYLNNVHLQDFLRAVYQDASGVLSADGRSLGEATIKLLQENLLAIQQESSSLKWAVNSINNKEVEFHDVDAHKDGRVVVLGQVRNEDRSYTPTIFYLNGQGESLSNSTPFQPKNSNSYINLYALRVLASGDMAVIGDYWGDIVVNGDNKYGTKTISGPTSEEGGGDLIQHFVSVLDSDGVVKRLFEFNGLEIAEIPGGYLDLRDISIQEVGNGRLVIQGRFSGQLMQFGDTILKPNTANGITLPTKFIAYTDELGKPSNAATSENKIIALSAINPRAFTLTSNLIEKEVNIRRADLDDFQKRLREYASTFGPGDDGFGFLDKPYVFRAAMEAFIAIQNQKYNETNGAISVGFESFDLTSESSCGNQVDYELPELVISGESLRDNALLLLGQDEDLAKDLEDSGFETNALVDLIMTTVAVFLRQDYSSAFEGIVADGLSSGGGRHTIAGSFRGQWKFGKDEISSSDGNVFISQWGKDGKIEWVNQIKPLGSEVAILDSLTLPSGDVFIAGHFNGQARFGDTLINPYGYGYVDNRETRPNDIFIAKINHEGIFEWATHAGGVGDDRFYNWEFLSDGSLMITGRYEESANFGDIVLKSNSSGTSITNETFLARLDGNGSWSVAEYFTNPIVNQSDYSNDPLNPTPILWTGTVSPYQGLISNSVGESDSADYLTLTVLPGQKLTSIILTSYNSTDGKAFIGLQRGEQVTGSASNPEPLIGYTHFGSGQADAVVGTNLINKLGGVLTEGTYSIWIQQLGAKTDYSFDLQLEDNPTIFEPNAVILPTTTTGTKVTIADNSSPEVVATSQSSPDLIEIKAPVTATLNALTTERWGVGLVARNVGTKTNEGTGQIIPLVGLGKYTFVATAIPEATTTINLEPTKDTAFFLHDAYSAFYEGLTLTADSTGRQSHQRVLNVDTIVMGSGGGTSIVDLTSKDYVTGAVTVYGANKGRSIFWGTDDDDTFISGGGDSVIFGGAGSNSASLGTGRDTLQYRLGVGAVDQVIGFDPAQDVVELWVGKTESTFEPQFSSLNGSTTMTWGGNTVEFVDIADLTLSNLQVINRLA